MDKTFSHNVKIYYEDTDSGGVVYYANYLKFIERARTHLIEELGFSIIFLSENYGCHFVVKKIYCNYIKSAKLEDNLLIHTKLLTLKTASFELEQNIFRDEAIIFKSKVLIANVNSLGKPVKIPQTLLSVLSKKI